MNRELAERLVTATESTAKSLSTLVEDTKANRELLQETVDCIETLKVVSCNRIVQSLIFK